MTTRDPNITDGEQALSVEDANLLVLEHRGWAESIARSVARAWNMDWKLDGLDGAAMEALIFCARRFQPHRGVPFKGYARKRIHEASTEQAKKSRGWQKGLGAQSKSDQLSREVSSELFVMFPELRMGQLPYPEESGSGAEGDVRAAIRHLLVGASIVAAKQSISTATPDDAFDYKRMIVLIGTLLPIHQLLLWRVYWEGQSLRALASEWETDELNVIREHKALLAHLYKGFSKGKSLQSPKVRPGLRHIALKLKRENSRGYFTDMLQKAGHVQENRR